MKRPIITTVLSLLALTGFAQEPAIAFHAEGVEQGIRQHLGLAPEAPVTQAQMDTITLLDLSCRGIADTRDLLALSNIRELDLSYNELTDIGCLYQLPTLERLNLMHNALEEIDMLMYSSGVSLEVDVTDNHITDYSAFLQPSGCALSLLGINSQRKKDEVFYSVQTLFADATQGIPSVKAAVYSTSTQPITLIAMGWQEKLTPDGSTMQITLPSMPGEVTPVLLMGNGQNDTTYIIPPLQRLASAGDTTTIRLALPGSLTITSLHAEKGLVGTADGQSITYIAPAGFTEDTVQLTFSHRSSLYGRTTLHLLKGLLGDANCDGKVDDQDIFTLLEVLMGRTPATCSRMASDLNGDGRISVADITSLVNKLH